MVVVIIGALIIGLTLGLLGSGGSAINQAKECWSMWLFKKYFLPPMYWQGMLKGRV